MENHPIPQDVTGFQFKLIGDMTVKQFAFLATSVIVAWILYAIPFMAIIKFPLIILIGLTGFSLAFVPVEGRPMDIMFVNFLKALFTPNQYVFQKVGGQFPALPPIKKNKQTPGATKSRSLEELQTFLNKLPKKPKNKLDEKEMIYFQSLASLMSAATPTSQDQHKYVKPGAKADEQKEPIEEKTLKPKQNGEQEAAKENLELEKEALLLKKALEQAQLKEKNQQNTVSNEALHQDVIGLGKQLSEVMMQKQQLENQLFKLTQQLQDQKKDVFIPTTAQQKTETQHVRRIPKSMGVKVGLPIAPDFPNIITGIIKDPRGNILPNILVEIKDKEGNPVRAFKTNNLGQFASATPLLNGIYTLEFEDPQGKNKFDVVELSVTGEIIMPLEIISTDAREELRKELFGGV